MASTSHESEEPEEDDLDPRIQIELESLNNATDEINKLEIELDEANGTFRMLMNDSTRRITLWAHKLGSCVDKARPYYEALEISKKAQLDCQRAAQKFQRAHEIHKFAKETVALAEKRYLSKQDEWQFDTAWQEMLNHATKMVTEAEHAKAESGREHQKRATLYNAAEQKVQSLEHKLHRNIMKSRPYFEEKAVCESGLVAQKQRLAELQTAITKAKAKYSAALRSLEAISEEIHERRKEKNTPHGPREPGVGAELPPSLTEVSQAINNHLTMLPGTSAACHHSQLEDLKCTIEVDETLSLGSVSRATSSVVSDSENDDEDLDRLKAHVRELSQMSGEDQTNEWEKELSTTIHRLDNALLLRECEEELQGKEPSTSKTSENVLTDPSIHVHTIPEVSFQTKQLKDRDLLPSQTNVNTLPVKPSLATELKDRDLLPSQTSVNTIPVKPSLAKELNDRGPLTSKIYSTQSKESSQTKDTIAIDPLRSHANVNTLPEEPSQTKDMIGIDLLTSNSNVNTLPKEPSQTKDIIGIDPLTSHANVNTLPEEPSQTKELKGRDLLTS